MRNVITAALCGLFLGWVILLLIDAAAENMVPAADRAAVQDIINAAAQAAKE